MGTEGEYGFGAYPRNVYNILAAQMTSDVSDVHWWQLGIFVVRILKLVHRKRLVSAERIDVSTVQPSSMLNGGCMIYDLIKCLILVGLRGVEYIHKTIGASGQNEVQLRWMKVDFCNSIIVTLSERSPWR